MNQNQQNGMHQPIYPYLYAPQAEQDEISILDLWRVLMDFKWSITLITMLVTSVSIAVAFLMTPIYRAEVILAPVQEEGNGGLGAGMAQLGGLASMVGLNVGGGDNTEQHIAALTSRMFLNSFINDEHLLIKLFADKWDAKNQQWLLDAGQKPPSALEAHTVFVKKILSTSVDKKSRLVTLAIEWKDPHEAASWANKLVTLFNEHQRNQAIAQSNRNIQYLQQQIQKTSVLEVQKMFYGLIENELKAMMMANVRKEFTFKVIDPAQPPEHKIKPNRALIVALGLVGGMMLGIFFAFFRNFIRNQKMTQPSSQVGISPAQETQ